MSLLGGTSRRSLAILWLACDYKSHIRLREATFSHENMLVSIRKKYHQTWGALGSDEKLAQNKACKNTESYLLLSTGNIMEIIAS